MDETVFEVRGGPSRELPGVSRSHARLRPVALLLAIVAVFAIAGLAAWMHRNAVIVSGHRYAGEQLISVALSLGFYSEHYKRLPYPEVTPETARPLIHAITPGEGRKSLYSWRVEIVPDLMSWHGTWDPSRAWDDPMNKQLVELSSFFAFGAAGREANPTSFPEADILAITGPGTAFGDGKEPPMALKDIPPQTILVVETRASGIPWPAPGDFDIRTMPRTVNGPDGKGISSRNAGGFHVIFADEWLWLLSNEVPFETLRKFFTIAEARSHDREKLLGPFALHRGP